MSSQHGSRIVVACLFLLNPSACAGDAELEDAHASELHFAATSAGSSEIPDIVIGDVKAVGTGCRNGSYTIGYDDHDTPGLVGHKAFAVYYNAYEIAVTSSQPFAEANCTLEVPIKAPAGWQYAVGQFVYRGRFTLDPAVRASVDVSYGFKGLSFVQLTNKRSMAGPAKNQIFEYTDTLKFNDLTNLSWSSCKDFRNLVIDSALSLQNPDAATGQLSMIRTEGSKGTQPNTGTRSRAAGDDDDNSVEIDVSSQKTQSGAFVGVYLRKCQ